MTRTSQISRRNMLSGAGAASLAAMAGVSVSAQGDGIILTVDPGTGSDPVGFTDADLSTMPIENFGTTTIWTEGEIEFSGPSLATVLEAAGVPVDTAQLRLTALNDYSVQFDMADLEPTVPIVANRIDGEPFGVRDKGPLWLVFPYDSSPRYRSESVFAVSVWQLRTIEVI